MTTAGSGAVFFLGTRAHYQVLQQPDSTFDAENGNASTETIYQNPSVQELWANEQRSMIGDDKNFSEGWSYIDNEGSVAEDNLDIGNGVKRRLKRRPSETTLCEKDNYIKPAILNSVDNCTPKAKSSGRHSILRFLSSLSRRKKRLDTDQIQYLQHLEIALTTCSYRGSCRCLDCQSRYFECDESDEYTSDEDSDYSARYVTQVVEQVDPDPDEDDEVFVDTIPDDNTSTDMLLESKEKMSTSSDETLDEDKLQLEVAATTPVLLNYLLTHPITCVVQ